MAAERPRMQASGQLVKESAFVRPRGNLVDERRSRAKKTRALAEDCASLARRGMGAAAPAHMRRVARALHYCGA